MIAAFLAAVVVSAPDDKKVTFADQVAAIFQARCNSCHNGDKQKGGLSLDSYGGAMKGGGSGKVVEPGDADGSRLYELVSHKDEPKMPPNSPKIPDAELAIIKAWIAGGALENSGSAAAPMKPKLDFKLDASAIGKPVGAPAMPENVSTEPPVISAKSNAITALATSPWAPLVAVSGHKQVLLYDTNKNRLAAVLPFPEGTIHVLKFTRDGAMLLAGGGRGGQSGKVIVWDVKTGKRLFEVGKEYDSVLAADISADRSLVALGGPSKILKVYSTSDGELVYESKKHTEWVTAIEFSPDGVLLASGDRNGGLVVWEAPTGREFYDLRGHTTAITDISWRLDSNLVASSSEDTTVKLWEMQNGGMVKNWGAHGGGTTSVRFAKDGRLVTTGRDRVAKVWDQNGGMQKQLETFGDLANRAAFTHDDTRVIAGDWAGEIRVWELKEGKRLANLSANPAAVATRLAQAEAALAAAQAASDAASKDLTLAQADAAAKGELVAKSQTAVAQAQQAAAQATAAQNAAEVNYQQKARVEWAANDAAWSADFLRDRMNAIKAQADAAKQARTEAAAGAAAVFAQTKSDRDRIIIEKAAALAAVAAKLADESAPAAVSSTAAAQVARDAQVKASAERTAIEAPLTALRQTANAANAVVPQRQNEFNGATAAKVAADKAVVDKTPNAQMLAAKLQAVREEAQALAVEKKAADATRAAAPAATAAKS
jgi:WD40 repeat protein